MKPARAPLIERPRRDYQDLLSQPVTCRTGVTADPKKLAASLDRDDVTSEKPPVLSGRSAALQQVAPFTAAGLTLGGYYGSGKTSFGRGLLWLASRHSRPVFDLNLQHAFPSPQQSSLDALHGLFERTGLTEHLKRGEPCTVFLDELNDLERQTHHRPALKEGWPALTEFLRKVAALPDVELVVSLQETRACDALREQLGFRTYAVSPLSPAGVQGLFQVYADLFGVTFDPPSIATIAYNATTPLDIERAARAGALELVRQGDRSGTITAAKFAAALGTVTIPTAAVYATLDRELLCAVLLQTPYRSRSPEETAKLERWVNYDVLRRADGGYAVTRSFFSEDVWAVIPETAWSLARGALARDPVRAVKILDQALCDVLRSQLTD